MVQEILLPFAGCKCTRLPSIMSTFLLNSILPDIANLYNYITHIYYFQMSVFNAARIYRENTGNRISDMEFRRRLITEILDMCGSVRKAPGRPSTLPSTSACKLVANSPGKGRPSKFRQCVVCKSTDPRKRSESKYKCESCKVTVCPGCFEPHQRQARRQASTYFPT